VDSLGDATEAGKVPFPNPSGSRGSWGLALQTGRTAWKFLQHRAICLSYPTTPGDRTMHCFFPPFGEGSVRLCYRLWAELKRRDGVDGTDGFASSRPPHPYMCLTLDGVASDMQQSPNLEQWICSADPAGLRQVTCGQDRKMPLGAQFVRRWKEGVWNLPTIQPSPPTNPALACIRDLMRRRLGPGGSENYRGLLRFGHCLQKRDVGYV
jgi:hypothetical protein